VDGNSGQLAAWEADLLAASRVARLGTIQADGSPHLVPVCYAVHNGSIYIAIDEKPKTAHELARLRNLRRDSRATLLVDRYDDDDWTQLAWVRLDCAATIYDHGGDHAEALVALRARYEQYSDMDLESLPLIELRMKRVVSWRWDG
jgi:PPOX class probable F420-dependent enzyme